MIERVLVLVLVPALCATVSFGQDPSPAASDPAIRPPWDAILVPLTERRYKVEAIRFKARDESGVDWWGADEVMVETVDAKGSTVSDEIDDIDSGDTHEFSPAVSCIIGVRPGIAVLGASSVCDEAGVAGPFSFTVEIWEKDGFDLGELFEVDFDFELDFGICGVTPGPGLHAGTDCADDGVGDDFIGGAELFFPVPDLETTLPNVGDSFTETVVLSPCGTQQFPPRVCGVDWSTPDYSFTYRTTRLPDVETDFHSTLLSAMQVSGFADAGDAVAAGLRALTAPVDRQAVTEPGPEPSVEPTVAGR